jgi:hypothetical protein
MPRIALKVSRNQVPQLREIAAGPPTDLFPRNGKRRTRKIRLDAFRPKRPRLLAYATALPKKYLAVCKVKIPIELMEESFVRVGR